jgi:acetylornithine deacetylase
MPAFTDGTHWSAAGIATVPAFGPGVLSRAHRPNEFIEIAGIVEAARIYALTVLGYLGDSAA